jgi:hypothetical protein
MCSSMEMSESSCGGEMTSYRLSRGHHEATPLYPSPSVSGFGRPSICSPANWPLPVNRCKSTQGEE